MEYLNGYKSEAKQYTKNGKEIKTLYLHVPNEDEVLDECRYTGTARGGHGCL